MGKKGRRFSKLEKIMTVEQFQDFAEDCSEYHLLMAHWDAHIIEQYEGKTEKEMQKIRGDSLGSDLHIKMVRAEAYRLYKKVQRLLDLFSVETALEEISFNLNRIRQVIFEYDLENHADRLYEEIPNFIRLKVLHELYLAMRDFLSSNEMNLLTQRDYAIILYYLHKHGYLDFKGNMMLLARIGAVLYNALPMVSVSDFYRGHISAIFFKNLRVSTYDIILERLTHLKPYQIDRLADIFEDKIQLPKIANDIQNDYTKAIDKHGTNYIGKKD